MPETEPGIEQRRHEREISLQRRRRRRWVNVAVVLAPVVLVALYKLFIAVPRYEAQSRFAVQSGYGQSMAGSGVGGSLLTMGGGLGAAGQGFVDGWAVSNFLMSRDCMQQLDLKIGLRRFLSHGGIDPFNHLAPDATEDSLYRSYQSMVKASYNVMEQINVLTVSAYSAGDAAQISAALIQLAQQFVNNVDHKGLVDALKVSKRSVAMAEKASSSAREALTQWRVAHANIDPEAYAGMMLNVIGQLEGQLTAAQIKLAKIQAIGNPENPMLRPAELEVDALRKRIKSLRQRVSGKGDTEAGQLKTYSALKNAQTFADENLSAARQNYQLAFTETMKLQRYLSVISRPIPSHHPAGPGLLVMLLEALAAGFVLALMLRLAESLLREFRHG
ncbi:sugar ABC transporter [Candidimonas nitroreducens]|uniref:sugar ABC transporter n=1 Tax=Candidimonas nitroreducens TaxID=683354 RepID=UPI001E4C6984|nr:sugar ABC transporter [Candidimonas nitroreducens]